MGRYITYLYLEYHRYRVHQRQESHYLVTYMLPVGFLHYTSLVASSGLARDYYDLFPQ